MMDQELQAAPDAEKQALNELISRFSADRDGLADAVERCQARLDELADRLASLAAAPPPPPAADPSLDAWRAEAERALSLAERNAEGIGALQRRVEEALQESAAARGELGRSVARIEGQVGGVGRRADETVAGLRTALEALERRVEAALAPTNVDPDETPWAEDVTKVRAEMIELREGAQRALGEAQAHLGVRVESIVAGVEAQVSRVQDDLWQRLGALQARLDAQAGTVERLRGELHDTQRGVQDLEAALAEQSRRGVRAFVERACNEVAAVVLGVASVGFIVGRYAAGAVLPLRLR